MHILRKTVVGFLLLIPHFIVMIRELHLNLKIPIRMKSQQMRHMQIEFEQWKTHDIWEQERESVEFNLKFIT